MHAHTLKLIEVEILNFFYNVITHYDVSLKD